MPPQLGWRKDTADELLFTPLFRFAYLEEMHRIPHGEVTNKWKSFVDDLFMKQDGFVGSEKTSVTAIRDQWEYRIEKFKTFHGWENGACKNNSGKEGDLTEPDNTIRNILREQWEDAQRKKTLDADKEQTNRNETTVLLDSFGSKAKGKRQVLDKANQDVDSSFDDNSGKTSRPVSSNTELQLAYLGRQIDGLNSPTPKKLKVSLEAKMEADIMDAIYKRFPKMPDMDNWHDIVGRDLKLTDTDSTIELLIEIDFTTLVSVFCTPGINFDASQIKSEFKTFGLNPVNASKLYNFLLKLKDSLLTPS